jgi:DNA-binding Lrp family transcriptional regulator
MQKLDKKDYKILKELDENFRKSFSEIAKKVGLSKNSVSLRFEKLKPLISHSVVGINNEALGYKLVKVYYKLKSLDNKTEKKIATELKKHKNILWAAKFYGSFDLSIALLVENLDELIDHTNAFNKTFSKEIISKEIQIVTKQYFFRHNYLYENKPSKVYHISQTTKTNLSETDKKILLTIGNSPRMNLVDIAAKTKLTTKTISSRLKHLEKTGVIMGYFMTLDNSKFNLDTFKLLIQINNSEKIKEFEDYLTSLKNIRHLRKFLGTWDYEIDCTHPHISDLQKEIEKMRQKFPGLFKKIEIVSFAKRIITNRNSFLA